MGGARPGAEFHAVLLAGGSGTRFWPLSRVGRPKQFLPLGGNRPLLEQTWRRLRKLAPPRRLWVVAPAHLVAEIRRHLPQLRAGNLVIEPSPRDTAPAVGLACAAVAKRAPGAVVGVFPTDHVVRDEEAFGDAVRTAIRAARDDALVCLGIRPDRPATGFGYLRCAEAPRGGRPVEVRKFVEKPTLARARRFLRSGNYLWNAGMFVWGAQRFLAELQRTAPGVFRAVTGHLEGRRGAWSRAPRCSVDYAVMEHARGVRVVPLEAGWDDVGSWAAAARLRAESGEDPRRTLSIDSPGSVVYENGRWIALIDVPNVVVVDTEDALLVVSRDSTQRVKEIVEQLRQRGRDVPL